MRSLNVSGGGGVTLYVEVRDCDETSSDVFSGDEVPTVVFVHGFSMSSRVWFQQMADDRLAGRARLVCWDLRGHGRSERPRSRKAYRSPKLWAEDLAAVIEATRDGGPVVVVGWSYGARVVGDYLREFGDDDVSGVVLVGARVKDDPDGAPSSLGPGLAHKSGMLSDDKGVADRATEAFVVDMLGGESDTGLVDIVTGEAKLAPWWVRSAMDGRPLTTHLAAKRCDVPVLIVHGTVDRMFPPAAGRVTRSVFIRSELVFYDRMGHAPFLECPDRFNADLVDFLRRMTNWKK